MKVFQRKYLVLVLVFNSGLVIQYGSTWGPNNVQDGYTHETTLPISFSTKRINILATPIPGLANITATMIQIPYDESYWYSLTSFRTIAFCRDAGLPVTPSYFWLVIGY